MDARTNEHEHTALHLAAFRHSLDSVKLLLDHGADRAAVNRQGLGVMHFAAQGDSAQNLCYFVRTLGLPIDQTDGKGSTPLHWAVYQK